MNHLLFRLSFVFFFIGLFAEQSFAQSDFDSSLTAKANKTLKKLGNDYNIEIVWNKKLDLSWKTKHRLLKKGEEKRFARYVELLDDEFRKYPKEYIKKTKLKTIYIGTRFFLGKQRRQAIPDYHKEILVLDFNTGSENYRRHVIHHEFYHMVEQQFNGSAYFKDPRWASFNLKKFKYGTGGANARGRNQYEMVHPKPGFVNRYSTSGLEEDKAEIYAVLFEKDNWRKVSPWIKDDPILAQKFEYMKDFLKSKDSKFDNQYWKKLHKKPLRKKKTGKKS